MNANRIQNERERGGGGQVVSALAYSDYLSLNPAEAKNLYSVKNGCKDQKRSRNIKN